MMLINSGMEDPTNNELSTLRLHDPGQTQRWAVIEARGEFINQVKIMKSNVDLQEPLARNNVKVH